MYIYTKCPTIAYVTDGQTYIFGRGGQDDRRKGLSGPLNIWISRMDFSHYECVEIDRGFYESHSDLSCKRCVSIRPILIQISTLSFKLGYSILVCVSQKYHDRSSSRIRICFESPCHTIDFFSNGHSPAIFNF